MKISEYLKKNKRMLSIILLALTGVLMVIFSYFIKEKPAENGYDTELTEYGEHLEQKLTNTLEKITGENTVDIVITFDSSFEKVYRGAYAPATQGSLSTLSNQTQPLEVKTKSPKIKGVMIVCTSIKTEDEFAVLKTAAATVLDISQNKIYIIGGDNGNEKSN